MGPFPNSMPGLDSRWPARWERTRIDPQTLIEPIWGQALLRADSSWHRAWPMICVPKVTVERGQGWCCECTALAGLWPPGSLRSPRNTEVGSDFGSASDGSWPSSVSLSHIGSSVTLKTVSCWDINTATNNNGNRRGRSKQTNISCTCWASGTCQALYICADVSPREPSPVL